MAATEKRYHKVSMSLHWLMALMIFTLIGLGLVMEDLKPISLRIDAYQLHKSLGITVLFLAVARIAWRITHPAPPLPANMNRLERMAAHASHWGFYALIIIMPLSGWIMASATKYPTLFFWLFEMPHLPLPEGIDKKVIEKQAYGVHDLTTQWIAIPMIIIHILAALFHHYIRKDNVLTRMLPRFIRRKS